MPDVDHRRQRPIANQQPTNDLDGTLRGREANAHRMPLAYGFQSLQAQRQMRAALIARNSMDLVDDDGLNTLQRITPTGAGQQQVQRFGSGDNDARPAAEHLRALVGG